MQKSLCTQSQLGYPGKVSESLHVPDHDPQLLPFFLNASSSFFQFGLNFGNRALLEQCLYIHCWAENNKNDRFNFGIKIPLNKRVISVTGGYLNSRLKVFSIYRLYCFRSIQLPLNHFFFVIQGILKRSDEFILCILQFALVTQQ